jgi:hypothetical protein
MALGSAQPVTEMSKGKAVPLQVMEGPRGFQEVRFPDFMTTAQDGGKVNRNEYQVYFLGEGV